MVISRTTNYQPHFHDHETVVKRLAERFIVETWSFPAPLMYYQRLSGWTLLPSSNPFIHSTLMHFTYGLFAHFKVHRKRPHSIEALWLGMDRTANWTRSAKQPMEERLHGRRSDNSVGRKSKKELKPRRSGNQTFSVGASTGRTALGYSKDWSWNITKLSEVTIVQTKSTKGQPKQKWINLR